MLRFNDFDDEWSTYKLSELSEQVKRKKENITDKDNILTISANKGFISQKERWDNVIAGKSLKKYTYLKKDEFSYNRGNSKSFKYGCIYRLNYENALVPNVYHSFRITNGDINFFEQLFQSKQLDKQLIKIITSTARMDGLLNISANNFFNIDVNIPNNLKEQKLIGDFLKLIDIKIELLENKYENYLNFKKYIMQQIFTQKLRFAKFTDDWKNCKFKDLGTVKSGVGFSTKYQGHLDLEYNLYKVSDMNLKGNEKIMVKSNNTIDDFILNEMNAKLITEPSIIFAKVGEAIFLNRKRIANKPFLIDNNMMAFTPNDKVNIDFMYYLSTTINFGKYAQTGALPSYNASDINTIKCKIPSKEEQEKIANILSLSDEKIDFYNDQLEKTKEFKKGLLQQMFI